jgi:hypothetical protein
VKKLGKRACAAGACVLPVFAESFAPEERAPLHHPAWQPLHHQVFCDWPANNTYVMKITKRRTTIDAKTHINNRPDLSHPNSNVFLRILKPPFVVRKFFCFVNARFYAACLF